MNSDGKWKSLFEIQIYNSGPLNFVRNAPNLEFPIGSVILRMWIVVLKHK